MTTPADMEQLAAFLERLRGILAWAVNFVADEVKVRRDSYTDSQGNFDADFEDQVLEIHDAERWLAEARAVLK